MKIEMYADVYTAQLSKLAFNGVYAICSAIPTWWCWNRVSPYLTEYIPEAFLSLPYWDIVCILFLIPIIGELIGKLIPIFGKG